jgi:hypothetical protein
MINTAQHKQFRSNPQGILICTSIAFSGGLYLHAFTRENCANGDSSRDLSKEKLHDRGDLGAVPAMRKSLGAT